MTGTCGYRIWGKMGAQGKEGSSKPAVVTEKRRRVCVREVQWDGGGVGGTRLSLETSEKLGSVNYVTRIHYDI